MDHFNLFRFAGKRAVLLCADNYIRVDLDRKYFNISKYEIISFRDDKCKAVVLNNTISLFSAPGGCGATSNETVDWIAFENDVILKEKLPRRNTFLRDESIPVRCAYKRQELVTVSFESFLTPFDSDERMHLFIIIY